MDSKPHPLTIPGSIIIAAAILAITIIYVKRPAPVVAPIAEQKPKVAITLAPITVADHILGNPNAPIRIVEFSDPSCPFCKIFHPTMKQIMDQYGPSGKVAWIYRAFPLDNLHPNARHESQAFECASALGGNDAFWKFADRLYEITPSDQGKSLDQKELPTIAKFAGLDAVAFNECLSSERFKEKIEAQYMDGVNAGVSGTPTNILVLLKPVPASMDATIADLVIKFRIPPVVISDDRLKIVMSGALPGEAIKAVIEAVLAGIN
jgi:protein-disulfide isomerase